MKHIYRNHCDESYEGAGEGAVTYFHPTLVKEQEAIAAEAEQAAEDNEVAVDGDDAGDDEGDESYEGAGEGAVTYFHPTLVKEQEAIAAEEEQAAEDNEVAVDGDDAGDDEGDEDDGELDMEAITETETASE